MKHFLLTQYRRFPHASRGIKDALLHDRSFQIQAYGGGAFVFLFIHFFGPLREIEALMLMFSWTLLLVTELQNSAAEVALDRLHPGAHAAIKRSKDMAAGAVFVAALFALGVVIWIFIS